MSVHQESSPLSGCLNFSSSGLLLSLSLSSLIHVLSSPNMCSAGARRGRTAEAAEGGELATLG